jgi:hypothetical protein
MSQYDVERIIHRLKELGVDTSELYQDYYKIPLENIDLKKVEKEAPSNKKVISKHNVIVDSRQRNYTIYPEPNKYLVELMEPHRNVERIELIAAMMPKTEYNINTENNLLIVTVNGVTKQLYMQEGQYPIGTNVAGSTYTPNGTPVITGLMGELMNTLNSFYGSPFMNYFNVFIATLPTTNGGTGNCASILNRIIITNSQDDFSIDFTNSNYSSGSPFRVLGFQKKVYTSLKTNTIYGTDNIGTCTASNLASGTEHVIDIASITGMYDYDLMDDPKYIIMELEFGNRSADRTESSDIATNQKFALIIYDANEPDVVLSSYATNGSVVFDTKKPGRLKALKGSDFDKKVIVFEPPITLENFKISFYKYDNSLYNFHNREHLLTFELDVADYDPKYRY